MSEQIATAAAATVALSHVTDDSDKIPEVDQKEENTERNSVNSSPDKQEKVPESYELLKLSPTRERRDEEAGPSEAIEDHKNSTESPTAAKMH